MFLFQWYFSRSYLVLKKILIINWLSSKSTKLLFIPPQFSSWSLLLFICETSWAESGAQPRLYTLNHLRTGGGEGGGSDGGGGQLEKGEVEEKKKNGEGKRVKRENKATLFLHKYSSLMQNTWSWCGRQSWRHSRSDFTSNINSFYLQRQLLLPPTSTPFAFNFDSFCLQH